MGVSVARVSQIEHGEATSFEVIARYVEALGGRLDLVADFGDPDRSAARQRHRNRRVTAITRQHLISPRRLTAQARPGRHAERFSHDS